MQVRTPVIDTTGKSGSAVPTWQSSQAVGPREGSSKESTRLTRMLTTFCPCATGITAFTSVPTPDGRIKLRTVSSMRPLHAQSQWEHCPRALHYHHQSNRMGEHEAHLNFACWSRTSLLFLQIQHPPSSFCACAAVTHPSVLSSSQVQPTHHAFNSIHHCRQRIAHGALTLDSFAGPSPCSAFLTSAPPLVRFAL